MLIAAAVGYAAVYLFTVKGTVEVTESTVTPSPSSFSFDASAGTEIVKQIKVKNSGNSTEIYFSYVVEGPDPGSVDVDFTRTDGTVISSRNKLMLPAGTSQNPSETVVNVHVKIDENAPLGEYVIFINARG
ncbi:MAG: hypothetical protein GXO63_02105 [Candidatus Micrarchaeota archaeon]|nr:hypothetical protein [Candidatus Micrarchaeota archaeon]